MAVKENELFRTLDPPAGGLAKLRGRIRGKGHRLTRVPLAPTVSAAVLTLAVVGWVVFAPVEEPDLPPELDLLRMQLGQLPLPSEAVTVPNTPRGQIAVRRVPLESDEVVFYLVDSVQ